MNVVNHLAIMILTSLVDLILHLDEHLTWLVTTYGTVTYLALFGIIFAETGFVITPFLPGDSLLFAAGAVSALGGLNVGLIWLLLCLAAVLGDTVNYWIGHYFGQVLVDNPRIPIKKAHIGKTEAFYRKHGGKTIILARFVPIVRTFAPFVAGVGKMDYRQFIVFNVVGGLAWVSLFTFGGYFFGNITFVKENFHIVIVAIIGLSVLPMVYEYWKESKPH